jgi:hypothetical protein
LAEEQLQGWLRIAPAGRPGQAGTDLLEGRVVRDPVGRRVAGVPREPPRPRRQGQLVRSAVPGA